MKRKIANFNSFMKNRLNEGEDMAHMSMDAYGMESNYGEEPEEGMDEDPELDDEGMEEEEEVTVEDLKAIIDDLEERVSALEGGEEGEEEEEEEGEEEGEEEEEESEEEEI